jgi:hypothetical protein
MGIETNTNLSSALAVILFQILLHVLALQGLHRVYV